MPKIELPHTSGCFVCGRDNPHGLLLSFHVDTEGGSISTTFTPNDRHIGFQGIIHGGVLATVLDEAMVWAAIWKSRRSCLAAEMTVRFKSPAAIGGLLRVKATVTRSRQRLFETDCTVQNESAEIVCTATGKYLSLSEEDSVDFTNTFIDEPATQIAAAMLRGGNNGTRV